MSASAPPPEPRLRVRIAQIDHTLIPPGPLDHSSLPLVPVIRIYGDSSAGKKACVHVHQVYPYFFVEYTGQMQPKYVRRYIAKLTPSLNHAVALSLRRNPHSRNAQYIRAILLVKGVHFYGFHSSYAPFLKIFVADPSILNRVATIMRSGTVMSTRFKIFESHLSYNLQFMCDFGLYGCGLIELKDALQRCQEDDSNEGDTTSVERGTVSLDPSPYFRQSRMPLEVDVIAPQIINRYYLVERNLHNKLEIPAPLLSQEPLVLGVRELWEDERKRRRNRGLHPSPEMPVDPTDGSRGSGGEWVAEARWWDELRKRVAAETEHAMGRESECSDWEKWTMSTFESIEALWEEPWKVWKPPLRNDAGEKKALHTDSAEIYKDGYSWDVNDPETFQDDGQEQIDVNLMMLSSQDIIQLDELEDEWDVKAPDEHRQMEIDDDDHVDEEDPFDNNIPSENDDSGPVRETSPQDPFIQGTLGEVSNKPVDIQFRSPPDPRILLPHMHQGFPETPTKIRQPMKEFQSNNTRNDDLQPYSMLQSIHELSAQIIDEDKSGNKKVESSVMQPEIAFKNPMLPISNPIRKSIISTRAMQLSRAFTACETVNLNRYQYSRPPPSISDLLESLEALGLPSKIYRTPYYSNFSDVPARPREYAGLIYDLKGASEIVGLEEWRVDDWTEICQFATLSGSIEPYITGIGGWEYASAPPCAQAVRKWLASEDGRLKPTQINSISQIKGPTQPNLYGFKDSLAQETDAFREIFDMTIFSILTAPSKGDKISDPESDEIVAAFYAFNVSGNTDNVQTGIIVLRNPQLNERRLRHLQLEVAENEIDLINRVVDVVVKMDPDVITGWEIQRESWGYLDARGKHHGFDVAELMSRAPLNRQTGIDQWGLRNNSTLKVGGRHVLNLWRIMKAEQTLTSYTFENVVFHVLHQRFPHYTCLKLTEWYFSLNSSNVAALMRYFVDRTCKNLHILEESEIVTKTAEFARVFGVDFFSVISRGSQFKVESFMFRIAKPESFVLLSPSKRDVGKQNAAECMPLIMEPLSAFYTSPVLVLDFQALYPSIMIAYNYCYSTCLGRVTDFKDTNKLGVVDLNLPDGLLPKLQEHITVAPNGIIFVKPSVRRGLLGRMLREILDTRVMIKLAMKGVKADKVLQRILNARQLGLKYIANVTYGYTSATFSGRMPAVEIADSIVQSGRETLEKAIDFINNSKKWGAQVVYGDTDSVFVHLKGKTKDQAFRIGSEIAEAITALNPAPIKLKFEKVYLPCVLMAKKRYVGFKFESIDEIEPAFDAKGIETVRRDGVLAQRKMTEACLKMLFRTQDLSKIKEFCCEVWTKMLENRASIRDFIFAKEVRMGTYSDKGPPPPGVMVALRRMVKDPNNEPHYGERIPYVIIRGEPGSRLVDRAVDPLELMANNQLRLDAHYYITRVLIPPLERILNLVGADVRQWFTDMPRYIHQEVASPSKGKSREYTPSALNIDELFYSTQCVVCQEPASQELCDDCYYNTQETFANLGLGIRVGEKRLEDSHRICVSCTGSAPNDPIHCESLDCPWLYARKKAEENMDLTSLMQNISEELEIEDDLGLTQFDVSDTDDGTMSMNLEENSPSPPMSPLW